MLNSKYKIDALKLMNSIVIKAHFVAVSMNMQFKEIDPLYTFDPEDIKTWPYYLNMNGQPHRYNNKIITKSPIDNSDIEITREFLEENRDIRSILLQQTDFYNSLMENYPSDALYIHGMMYPIDMDKLVEANECEILYVDDTFIEWNEENLIQTIQEGLYIWFKQIFTTDYISTDTLYGYAIFMQAKEFIYKKILETRVFNINTHATHSYYIIQALNSILGIGEFVDILSRESLLWLYININYIVYNLGKESTLDLIHENIVKPNGMYIYEYILEPVSIKRLPKYTADITQTIENSTLFKKMRGSSIKTLETITELKTKEQLGYLTKMPNLDTYYSRILRNSNIRNRSKDIEIRSIDQRFDIVSNREDILFDAIILILSKFNRNMVYNIQTEDGIYLKLTGEKMLIILLASLFQELNISMDTIISTYNVKNILSAYTDNVEVNIPNHIIAKRLDYIKDILLQPLYINIGKDAINRFIKKNILAHELIGLYRYNTYNSIDSDFWVFIYNRLLKESAIPLFNNKSIKELLNIYNIDTALIRVDMIDIIFRNVSGISIMANYEADRAMEAMRRLVDRLTPYTIQVLRSVNSNYLSVNTGSIDVMHSYNIVDILRGEYDCNGAVSNINIKANDDRLKGKVYPLNTLSAKTRNKLISVSIDDKPIVERRLGLEVRV